MFDVSFAEILVLVTGAGFLLGRKEILQGSRVVGKMLGRGVGLLQGVRVRYEEKTRGSRVHQMHTNVKMGLRDMNTIGLDLAMVGSGMPTRTSSSPPAVTAAISTAQNPVPNRSSISALQGYNTAANARLARLILVEEKLQGDQDRPQPLSSTSNTADIVQSAITGSIMNEYYAREMEKDVENMASRGKIDTGS